MKQKIVLCYCGQNIIGEGGVRQGQLVNWYLTEIQADIETVEELAAKKILVEKIVERLVQHVSVT